MDRYDDAGLLEERAAEDLSGAEDLLRCVRNHSTLIRFHLQQYVEKMMKVELSRHNVNYPWTHDLVVLLSLFPQKKISDDYKTFADILSQFAVGTRYGEYLKCPWSDREILEKAKEFVKHIETLWEDPSN